MGREGKGKERMGIFSKYSIAMHSTVNKLWLLS